MIGRNLNDEIKNCPFTDSTSKRYIRICSSIFRFLVLQNREFKVSAIMVYRTVHRIHKLSFQIDDITLSVADEPSAINFRYFRKDVVDICTPLFSIPTKGNYTMMVRNTISVHNSSTPKEDMFKQLGYHFYVTIHKIFYDEVFCSPDNNANMLIRDLCKPKELFLMFTRIKSAVIHSLQETTHIDYELKFEDNSFRVYLLSEKDVYLSLTVYDNDCRVSIFKDGYRLTKSCILDYFGSKMTYNLRDAFYTTQIYYDKMNGTEQKSKSETKKDRTTFITDLHQDDNKPVINTTKAEEPITNESLFKNFNESLIEKVIYNNPQVTVIWKDGTKTSAKTNHTEDVEFVPAIGLALCIAKKFYGNQHQMLKRIPKDATEHKLSKKEIRKNKKNEEPETNTNEGVETNISEV